MRPLNYILIGAACVLTLSGTLILVGQDATPATKPSEEALLKETAPAAPAAKDDALPAELGGATNAPAPVAEVPAEVAPAAQPPAAPAPVAEVPAEVAPAAPPPAAPVPAAEVPAEVAPAAQPPAAPAPAAEVPAEVAPAAQPPAAPVPVAEVPAELAPAAPPPAAPAPIAEVPAEVAPTAPAVTAEPAAKPVAEAPTVPATVAEPATVIAPAETGIATPEPLSAEVMQKRLANARDLANQEEVRRKELAIRAGVIFQKAESNFDEKDYTNALSAYREVLKFMPNKPQYQAQRKRALSRIPECEYRYLLTLMDQGKPEEAQRIGQQMIAAGTQDPKLLRKVVDRAAKEIAKADARAKLGPIDKGRPDTTRQGRIRALIKEGRSYIAARNFDKAKELFEAVLAIEPQNKEAMSQLEGLAQKKFATSSMERSATSKGMVADVRATWNPPTYKEIKPKKADEPKIQKDKEANDAIIRKMESIIIPEIEFRAANINDVVDFLNKASQEGDKTAKEGEPKGINLILSIGAPPAAAPAATPGGTEGGGGEPNPFGGGGGAAAEGGITFTARFISLRQALDIITKVTGLKYRVEGNVVMIVRREDDAIQNVITRIYPVEPTFIERVRGAGAGAAAAPAAGGAGAGGFVDVGAGAGGGSRPEAEELKACFINLGVPFPVGTTISYNAGIGKVIVANTEENLEKFEALLAELNVVPAQVEIEARFVEVNETQLEELGFEWLLNDNWELASNKSSGTGTSAQRIVVNKNSSSGGFTKGLRFQTSGGQDATSQGGAGSILSVSSILTNPELGFVLHALEQKGHADVLSAPKITTRSGFEATIKVVTEYIYPTEFEVQGGTLTPAVAGTAAATVQETVVVPQNFQTRDVGVMLTCQPEVSQTSPTINLILTPQVVTEPTWHQYGSTIRRADGSEMVLNMPQPFFHTRTVTTQISIYDGATVVMGGLITESLRTVDDKIPFLGSIPLLGKLFSSSSQRSEKRNLLIFVTARLVSPAGKVIRQPEADEEKPVAAPVLAPAPTT